MLRLKQYFLIVTLNIFNLVLSLPIFAVETPMGDIPQWVLNPVIEDGIAASGCVVLKDDVLVASRQAQAQTMLAIAEQLEGDGEGGVEAIDTSKEDKSFSAITKQFTQQKLISVRQLKWAMVNIADQKHVCVLMGVSGIWSSSLYISQPDKSKVVKKNKVPRVL